MSNSELSELHSPASTVSMEENIDEYPWNGLILDGAPFGLEKIYDYESGGHHPVHLGDRLGRPVKSVSKTKQTLKVARSRRRPLHNHPKLPVSFIPLSHKNLARCRRRLPPDFGT